jgi:putative acetyltransferase
MNIIEITNRTDSLTKQLLDVWESAVRQTHTFLSESEILRIKGYVPDAIGNVARLLVSMDDSDKAIAFPGLEGSKIEMLFVDASHRGRGIGKQMLAFAIENCAASKVTVNEQNPLAIGFYEHMGFRTYKRTDFDEEGNPYPLLYMRLNKK